MPALPALTVIRGGRVISQFLLLMISTRKLLLIGLVLVVGLLHVQAQSKVALQQGEVSFVTSTSVYVRFADTQEINENDTLFLYNRGNMLPVLLVAQKSSLSCVSRPIGGQSFSKGDLVWHRALPVNKASEKSVLSLAETPREDPIDGLVSFTSYINASTAAGTNVRNLIRLRLSANEISNTRFSFNTYLIYRQNMPTKTEGSQAASSGLFNVYNASLSYKKDSSYSFSVGRFFNRRVASLGMMDGVYFEKQVGKLYAGAIAGYRPDILTNDFNSNLFQYGGYVGLSHFKGMKSVEISVGALQQQNKRNTDRRFLFFQGAATIGRRLSLFSSAEFDLYTLDSTLQQSNSQLTNIHLATNYMVSEKIRLSVSYDSRKSIVYYESFQPFLEDILADNEARQVLRARVNAKVTKRISAGLAYGKRFQQSLQNASDNINAFVMLRQPPWINGTLSGNLNINMSPFLTTLSANFRHSNSYLSNRLHGTVFLRSVFYSNIPERETIIIQQFFGASGRYMLKSDLSLGGVVEFSIRKAESRSRVNIQLTKRF
jgi:hypothetical protein